MVGRQELVGDAMKIGKWSDSKGKPFVGLLEGDQIIHLGDDIPGGNVLSSILHSENPKAEVEKLRKASNKKHPSSECVALAPIDGQEVWAAGVTYLRSREARERESEGAAKFYDLVYKAARPEIFFKAPARRVIANKGMVRVRKDSKWSVPEPELTLCISPRGKIVGFTIGNDMSARDIEGENPLYLPQAKIYSASCAVGPCITLAGHLPHGEECVIRMTIHRAGVEVFQGQTSLGMMARKLEDLADWLFRENDFPDGVFLLTGTGTVPPDNFTLNSGDIIRIEVTGIGVLENTVA